VTGELVGQPIATLATAAARPGGLLGVFGRIGGHRFGDDGLGDLRADPLHLALHRFRRPVSTPRRIRGDLAAIDRDHPDPHHPSSRTQLQDLGEQTRERLLMLGAEPGDGGVIGSVLGTQHPEGHMVGTQPFDTPRRALPTGVGVDQ
jgi:hypothetical protein